MHIINRLIKLANKIDQKDPKLADKLEKTAANMLNMYVPQNVLEQGYNSVDGTSLGSGQSLGGFHTQLELNTMGLDPTSKNVAISLMHELVTPLPPYEQWVAAHQHLGANPQEVYQALGIMQQLYQMGVQDTSDMGQAMAASGPLDLQFATQNPSQNFQYFGITPQEIMKHEEAHAHGKRSTKEEYLQRINQGADIINTNGIGGGVNPRYKPYQFMQSVTGPGEYGPNLHVLERLIRENR